MRIRCANTSSARRTGPELVHHLAAVLDLGAAGADDVQVVEVRLVGAHDRRPGWEELDLDGPGEPLQVVRFQPVVRRLLAQEVDVLLHCSPGRRAHPSTVVEGPPEVKVRGGVPWWTIAVP